MEDNGKIVEKEGKNYLNPLESQRCVQALLLIASGKNTIEQLSKYKKLLGATSTIYQLVQALEKEGLITKKGSKGSGFGSTRVIPEDLREPVLTPEWKRIELHLLKPLTTELSLLIYFFPEKFPKTKDLIKKAKSWKTKDFRMATHFMENLGKTINEEAKPLEELFKELDSENERERTLLEPKFPVIVIDFIKTQFYQGFNLLEKKNKKFALEWLGIMKDFSFMAKNFLLTLLYFRADLMNSKMYSNEEKQKFKDFCDFVLQFFDISKKTGLFYYLADSKQRREYLNSIITDIEQREEQKKLLSQKQFEQMQAIAGHLIEDGKKLVEPLKPALGGVE